ncbi:MAG: flavodoxin-dependent (E)-4-hydroxy-3-methylbut-2-enyl-diphosphate synthase [Candidatus Lightella neohaematopini]|nr:flavodoxin-dependent (E)-4-hydroxy-3-methylbut-2-enyl-diphosphate synthase [Candidatus Lightella neohaematopini]
MNKIFIRRRKSNCIYVGNVPIGSDYPISVQSMTNTDTVNVEQTVNQINTLKFNGADIIRVSIPNMDAAESFKKIRSSTKNIPLVADIHFDYRIALKVAEYGVDCIRINPGNIGNIRRIKTLIDCAKYYNIPIRIGVNSGSLEREFRNKYNKIVSAEALFESVMQQVNIFDKLNFGYFKVSVKSSDVLTTIKAYQLVAKSIDQPLHVGVTETGTTRIGITKSAIGIGLLLMMGIGDTIRVSLTTNPVEEVKVAFDILRSLHLRYRGINFITCPTCARQEFDVINTTNKLEKKLQDIITPINISIIGCIVNGLGEALRSDIGLVGGRKNSSLYINGIRQPNKIQNNNIVDYLELVIRSKTSTYIK